LIPRPFRNPAFLTSLLVLLTASIGMSAAIKRYKLILKKEPIYAPEGRKLMALPSETQSWVQVGSDRLEEPEVQAVLGTENYVTRVYVEKGKPETDRVELNFHAAYYTGMIDTVPHVPDRCFVGGGLAIGSIIGNLPLPLDQRHWRRDDTVPLHLAGKVYKVLLSYDNRFSIQPGGKVRLPRDPQDIRLRTMEFLAKDGTPFYAGYFFIANGGTVCEAEHVRLLAFDLKSTYAYYLKVQVTSARNVNSGEELAAAAARLLDELLGEVMLCAPDWVEVELGNYPARNTARSEGSPPPPDQAGAAPGLTGPTPSK